MITSGTATIGEEKTCDRPPPSRHLTRISAMEHTSSWALVQCQQTLAGAWLRQSNSSDSITIARGWENIKFSWRKSKRNLDKGGWLGDCTCRVPSSSRRCCWTNQAFEPVNPLAYLPVVARMNSVLTGVTLPTVCGGGTKGKLGGGRDISGNFTFSIFTIVS